MDRMVSTEEAARRLGVKVTTLYAYVSRGLLASHPEIGGRRSLFDLSDIERLAARQRGGRQVESRLATITTGVTQLREDGPYYRGRPATELATAMSFEDVAALLWQADEDGDWSTPDLGVGQCPLVDTADRMRWALVMCGASDPLRADLRPKAVNRAARRVIAALTDVVGDAPVQGDNTSPRTDCLAAGAPSHVRQKGRGVGRECRARCSWLITSSRRRHSPSGWPPPLGLTSTTRSCQALPPWPDPCTGGRANGPTSCWCQPNGTGHLGR